MKKKIKMLLRNMEDVLFREKKLCVEAINTRSHALDMETGGVFLYHNLRT